MKGLNFFFSAISCSYNYKERVGYYDQCISVSILKESALVLLWTTSSH